MTPGTGISSGIAAGHPATAEAGLEILSEGGSAADAAVAASLASCVAETVMTGIAGGGHAIVFDAARRKTRLLDFFCAVPGVGLERERPELVELAVPFGAELVHYAIGIASCAVPGVPAGLGALWEAAGTMPWPRLVEPALRLAREGVVVPPAHASCLAMLAPVMTMREGERIYAPRGKLLEAGERMHQPGLARALELLADEGPASFGSGSLGRELLDLMDGRGGLVTASDLRAYRPTWSDPVETSYAGARVATRGGLAGIAGALARLPALSGATEAERALALCDALEGDTDPGETTNLTVVDPRGNACVVTTSLGLGSGDFLPGLDVHLNSMLGETDLLVGTLEPGERMPSMMAPTLAFRDDELVLAAGAAGGTRLRSALVQVLGGVLDEGLAPQDAIDRPRLHPAADVVHLEPGFADEAVAALSGRARAVRVWPELHHFFGGVSALGTGGAGADPRRSGRALLFG